MATGLNFKSRYYTRGEDVFDQIVIRDQKQVRHFTIKMKRTRKQWIVKGDDCPVKVKRERSASKVYHTGKQQQRRLTLILLCTFGKQSGRNIQCVILWHDNARPHKVQLITIFAGICSIVFGDIKDIVVPIGSMCDFDVPQYQISFG